MSSSRKRPKKMPLKDNILDENEKDERSESQRELKLDNVSIDYSREVTNKKEELQVGKQLSFKLDLTCILPPICKIQKGTFNEECGFENGTNFAYSSRSTRRSLHLKFGLNSTYREEIELPSSPRERKREK
jgi:hypothetical protein